MSLFGNPDDLRLLQNLLNPQEQRDDSDLESDEERPLLQERSNITPGNIGPAMAKSRSHKSKNKAREPLKPPPAEPAPQNIEEWQDMQEKIDAEALETRKCPEYTMTYRQAVGTEDVYLQMGNRSACSASCEDLIMEIALPEEATPADKWNLSITEREVDLATSIYRLKVPLVHAVDVDRCRAKHDTDLRRLCLSLRLKREFDFVNF